MSDSLYVAWKYVQFNKLKTGILVSCIALITFLPLCLRTLVAESEAQLMDRAEHTPLVIGAKGSALDLVMSSLYFSAQQPEPVSMVAARAVDETGLALAIPLYTRFEARGAPVVGTTLDYFDFRGLRLRMGREMAVLGECVIGASLAERVEIGVGDTLVSTPENLFDLAGAYPLEMKVVGVLERMHSPDDLAAFVDVKTAWIMAGLGHGHEDLAETKDASVILKRDGGAVTANAKLREFTVITDSNLDSFHFHGDPSAYPLTAVIAIPKSEKARVILMGRFEDAAAVQQVARPAAVIEALLDDLFKIERLVEAGFLLVGVATLLAIVLVFVLSLRLRQREIETIFKLGCSRMMIGELMAAEIGIILLLAGALTTAALWLVSAWGSSAVRVLISW